MSDGNMFELSEAEVEVINLLRGHDHAAGVWFFSVSHEKDGSWWIDEKGKEGDDADFRWIGSGPTFEDAWITRCHPALRQPLTDEEKAALVPMEGEHGVRVARLKPQLRLVPKGGDDGQHS